MVFGCECGLSHKLSATVNSLIIRLLPPLEGANNESFMV